MIGMIANRNVLFNTYPDTEVFIDDISFRPGDILDLQTGGNLENIINDYS